MSRIRSSRAFVVALIVAAVLAQPARATTPVAALQTPLPTVVVDIATDIGAFGVAWSTVDKALYVAGNSISLIDLGVDVYLRKYDSAGHRLWQTGISTSVQEYVRGLAVDPTGGVVIAGWRVGPQGDDVLLAKFSSSGVQQWKRTYDDWSHGDDRANAVAVDSVGRIWVAGRVPASGDSSSKVWWSRWTASGQLSKEWTAWNSVVGRAEAFGIAVRQTSVAIVGYGYEVVDGSVSWASDAFVGVYDTGGADRWHRTFGRAGHDDTLRGVAFGPAGELYVTGETSTASGGDEVIVRRYGPSGGIVWKTRVERAGDDSGRAIAVSPNGETVVVAGMTGAKSFESDAIVRAYRRGGGLLWSRLLDSPGPSASASTPDAGIGVAVPGPVYVSGRRAPSSASAGYTLPWVARLVVDTGTVRWTRTFQPGTTTG